MGYRAGGTSGRDQGFREIIPRCKPGTDHEACRRELLIETAGYTFWVVAAFAVAGGACWFVLSDKWTVRLIKLEQKIRSSRR